MAMTMNYARLAATSPKAVKKARQKQAAVAKETAWIKKYIANGGNHKEARAAYAKHRRAVEADRAKLAKAWKKSRHQMRQMAYNQRRHPERLPSPVGARAPSQKPRPTERPNYRPGLSATDFYRCWEWQTLRYRILREFGPKCMCCGGWGNHVDHIRPRSKHPSLELDPANLQVLCESCNVGKSNLFEDDWRNGGVSPAPA